ncbi:hypothetical protein [Vibrio phage 4141]|uniref:Uncharacterized protein n=2 Tax=Chatterjeevirus TaxID=2732679 RepID=D0Q186_9CAUD|nr:hypothetical protein VN4_02 [Vibrio phage N4]ACR16467.1 hypothetical protein VN4_02 [Vibrio phage N4]
MSPYEISWASSHDWFEDSFEVDDYLCVLTTCGIIFTNFDNMKEWAEENLKKSDKTLDEDF